MLPGGVVIIASNVRLLARPTGILAGYAYHPSVYVFGEAIQTITPRQSPVVLSTVCLTISMSLMPCHSTRRSNRIAYLHHLPSSETGRTRYSDFSAYEQLDSCDKPMLS